jgi:SAM-dependent methyltransferase
MERLNTIKAIDFDVSSFEFLSEMEKRHFWHVGRREIILDILRRNIPELAECRMLEIGCGNGNVLAYLKQKGVSVSGGDIFMEGLRFCRQCVDSAPLYQLDATALPFLNRFDVIGLFDVLEHIEDDGKALSESAQALKYGGRILVTVPAHMSLWSYFDACSCHKRRYGKAEIEMKIEKAGFAIKRISYYMTFLLPLFAIVRWVGNIFGGRREANGISTSFEVRNIPIVNGVFLGLLRLEKWLMRYFSLPIGASLIILAEKIDETK